MTNPAHPLPLLARLGAALAITTTTVLGSGVPAHSSPVGPASVTTPAGDYEFVCENEGAGLSIHDVLEATGDHGTFLDYFAEFDPEGYAILGDPELADKTVWAPNDAAFAELGDAPSLLSAEEITAVLGYHITPPRRTPEGPYPIITPQYLVDGGEVIHQTRTGIVTGSDERVRTTVADGVLKVGDATILPTSWCTQTGSVFSISAVLTEGSPPTFLEQAIFVVFFQYPLVFLIGTIVVVVGLVLLLRSRRRRRTLPPDTV
ncbi:MAG: fasciclin domain-containing protein [Microcella sp.]|uniref:fasciclin domain-containing protein n=1 Tax=Microcella sp. TaxID=1913979 RepID=UPI003314EB89